MTDAEMANDTVTTPPKTELPKATEAKVEDTKMSVEETKPEVGEKRKAEDDAAAPEAKKVATEAAKIVEVDAAVPETEKPVTEAPQSVEPEAEKPAAEAAKSVEEVAAVPTPAAEAAKSAIDIGVLRRQVEYYFSDMNLQGDAFFHKKISESKDNWLEAQFILSCKKIQALGATMEDIKLALAESPLEVREEEPLAVRRKEPLPELKPRDNRSGNYQKTAKNPHEGGCIFKVSGIPEGKRWGDVKDLLKVKLPKDGKVLFATSVKAGETSTTMFINPFEGDIEFLKTVELEFEGLAKLTVEILDGQALVQAVKDMPSHVQKKRMLTAKDRQKAKQKPIYIGEQKFSTVNALRGKMKEILASRKDGAELKPDAPDFMLVKAVISHHPRAEQKLKGMTGLKVDRHTQSDTRCFFVLFADQPADDISMVKCLAAIDQNPPPVPEGVVVEETIVKGHGKGKGEGKGKGKGEKGSGKGKGKGKGKGSGKGGKADEKKADEKKAEEVKPVVEKKAEEAKPVVEAKPAADAKTE